MLRSPRLNQRLAGIALLSAACGIPGLVPATLEVPAPSSALLKSIEADPDLPIGANVVVAEVIDFAAWSGEAEYLGGDVSEWQSGAIEWSLPIHCKGADGIRVHLTGLSLPAGATLQFIDAAGAIQGTVTGTGPFGDGEVWSPVLNGSTATLAVFVSEEARAEASAISFIIEQVAHMGGDLFPEFSRLSSKAIPACQTALPGTDPMTGSLAFMVYSRGAELQYALSGVAVATPVTNSTILTSAYGIRYDSQARSASLYGASGGTQVTGAQIIAAGLGEAAVPDFTMLEFSGSLAGMTGLPLVELGGSLAANASYSAKGFALDGDNGGAAVQATVTIPTTNPSGCANGTAKVGARATSGVGKQMVGAPVVGDDGTVAGLLGPACGQTTIPVDACQPVSLQLTAMGAVLDSPTRFGGTVREYLSGATPCTLTVDSSALFRPGQTKLCKSEQTLYVVVNTAPNCAWTVSDNASWLTPLTTSGTGPGAVFLKVAANTAIAADGTPAQDRTAALTVTVGGGTPQALNLTQSGMGSGARTIELDRNLLLGYRRKVLNDFVLDTCGPEDALRIELEESDVEVIVRMSGADGVNADLWVGAAEDVLVGETLTRPNWLSSSATSRETVIINSASSPALPKGVPLIIRPYVSRFTDLASSTTEVDLEIIVRKIAPEVVPIPVTPVPSGDKLVAQLNGQSLDRVTNPYRVYLLNVPTDFAVGEVLIETLNSTQDLTMFAADTSRLALPFGGSKLPGPDIFRGGSLGISNGVIRVADVDDRGYETIISNSETNSLFTPLPNGPVWVVGVLPENGTVDYTLKMTVTGRTSGYYTAPLTAVAPGIPVAGKPTYREEVYRSSFTLGEDLYQYTKVEVPRFPASLAAFQAQYLLTPFNGPRTHAIGVDIRVATTAGDNTASVAYAPFYGLPLPLPIFSSPAAFQSLEATFLLSELPLYLSARTYQLANKFYPRFRLADEYSSTSPVNTNVAFPLRYPVSAGDLLLSPPGAVTRDFALIPDDVESVDRHLVPEVTVGTGAAGDPVRRERTFNIRRDGGGQGSTILAPGTWTLGVLRNSVAPTVFEAEATVRYPQQLEPVATQELGPFSIGKFDSHYFSVTLPAGTTMLEAELISENTTTEGTTSFPKVNLLLNRFLPAYERTREWDAALTDVTRVRSARERFVVSNPLATAPTIEAFANGVAADLDSGTTRNPIPGDTWFLTVTSNSDNDLGKYRLRISIAPGAEPQPDVLRQILGTATQPFKASLDANQDEVIDAADLD
ncbi:hypothetical protein GC173_04910 [bacterium]|nr:hypothetical protein [bacterium]